MFNSIPAIVSAASGGGGSAIELIGSEFIEVNGTSYTVAKPAGTLEGDLMIAFIHFYVLDLTNNAGTHSKIATSPAGWTDYPGTPHTVVDSINQSDATLGLQYKIAGPSEPGNYTWTKVSNSSGLYENRVAIVTFRNAQPALDFFEFLGHETNHFDQATIWSGTDTGASDTYLTGLHYGTNGYVESSASNIEPSVGSPANTYSEVLNYFYGNNQNLYVQTAPASGAGAVSAELNLIINSVPPSRLHYHYMMGMKASAPFTWSETFPRVPGDESDVVDFLGINGTISPDLGADCVSHVANLNRTDAWSVGQRRYIAAAGGGVLADSLSSVVDADFNSSHAGLGWSGSACMDLATKDSVITLNEPADFPSVADGTRSCMLGFVGRIDSLSTAGDQNYITGSRTTTAPYWGWWLQAQTNSPGTLIGGLIWQDGTTNYFSVPNGYALGVPFVAVMQIDFFNNEVTVASSGIGAGGTVSTTFPITPPASVFHQSGRDWLIGSWNFGTNEGIIGRAASFWICEWDAAIDASGFGAANIDHFLKKTDNVIPPASPQWLGPLPAGSNTARLNRCWQNTAGVNEPGMLVRRRGSFNNLRLDAVDQDFTIEGWFYLGTDDSHTTLVGYKDPTFDGNGWMMSVDATSTFGTGLIRFRSALGTSPEISPRPNEGVWYHVALTRNAGTCQWYLNGATNGATFAYSGAMTGQTQELTVGGSARASYDGELDRFADIRIWNIARSAGQISASYNTALAGDETGLIAYWPLQYDTLDYGPNGYHLTQTGKGQFATAGPVP